MSIPPSPKLPPMPAKKKEDSDFCIIHKGKLSEDVYTCKCGAKMCYSCALERKNSINRVCPKCSSIIIVKS